MTYIQRYRSPAVRGIFSFLILLGFSVNVQSETRTIVSDAIYSMGDGETPIFAEEMVLQKAKQRALEEAGTYVESYTHVRNLDLTTDEIKTIAGGMMKIEILERRRAKEGNGFQFYVKIRALVTTDKIEDLARRIKGRNVSDENRKILESFAKIESRISHLERELAASKTETERELILDKIRAVESEFRQVRLTEVTLYQRILSGEELSAQVSRTLRAQQKQIEEDQRREEWQVHALKFLLETLRSNGFTLVIDPPEINVHLSKSESTTLIFPVTINSSNQLKQAIKDLQQAYSGDLSRSAENEIEKSLKTLTLSVSVFLTNGSEYKGELYPLTFKSLQSYDLNSIMKQQTISVRIKLPSPFVQQVASVEGRIIRL